MGNIQGPQKENDTCVNTMNVETMDTGFSVLTCINILTNNIEIETLSM